MRHLFALLCLALLLALPGPQTWATTFDVNVNSTSITINCALSDIDNDASGGAGNVVSTTGPVMAGDAIRLIGSATPRAPLKFQNCYGAAGNLIEIRNRASDADPVTIKVAAGASPSYGLSFSNVRYVKVTGIGGWGGGLHVDECGWDYETRTLHTDGCGIRIEGTDGVDNNPTNWLVVAGGGGSQYPIQFPIADANLDKTGNMRDLIIEGVEVNAADRGTVGTKSNILFAFNDHDLCQSSFERRVFTVSGVTTDPVQGDIYRDAGDTVRFTVTSETVSGGAGTVSTSLTTGSNLTAVASSGTLTKVSGTGDATLTYSATALNQRWRDNVTFRKNYLHDNTQVAGSGEGMYFGPNWARDKPGGENLVQCPDAGVEFTPTTTPTVNPTAGAIYRNAGDTLRWTVAADPANGTASHVYASLTTGSIFTSVASSGTLTKVSGTGDATIAYTSVLVTNGNRNGIQGDDEHRLRDITISSNYVDNVGQEGINLKSCVDEEDDCLITRNYVSRTGKTSDSGGDGTGIGMFEGEATVTDNTLVDVGEAGISWNTGNYTGDAGQFHAIATNNLIIRAGAGAAPNAVGNGISGGNNYYSEFHARYNSVVGSEGAGISPDADVPVAGISIIGNISVENGGSDIVLRSGGTYSNNIPSTTNTSTAVYADAGFADYLSSDYSLDQGSDAIDVTTTSCPTDDIVGTTRPVNTLCDLGAFEYQVPSAPDPEPVGRILLRGVLAQ